MVSQEPSVAHQEQCFSPWVTYEDDFLVQKDKGLEETGSKSTK